MTREEAIYWIKNLAVLSSEKDMASITEALEMAIEALNKKTGYWMETGNEDPCWYRCSECGRLYDLDENYCPNCGARMESDTE